MYENYEVKTENNSKSVSKGIYKHIYCRNMKRFTHILLITVMSLLMVSSGCKIKEKRQQKAALELKKQNAKTSLQDLLSNNSKLSLDEKEKELKRIKALNFEDQEILDLIKKTENELKAERIKVTKEELQTLITDKTMSLEEKEKKLRGIKALSLNDPEIQNLIKELEADIKAEKEKRTKKEEIIEKVEDKLNRYFEEIANDSKAGDFNSANAKIKEITKLFASDNANVLILISEEDGIKDYDKPTTIKKYIENVKFAKRYDKKVNTLKQDASGKITTIEFRK